MRDANQTWSELSAATCQVLLCDLQQEIVARSKTTSPDNLGQSAEVLGKISQLFHLPITLSVVPENNQKPRLLAALDAFVTPHNELMRATASPFVDAPTRSYLASLERRTLLIAGFATEVVVLHAALHALREGYGVIIAVDACGGMSDRTESAALQQIREGGGVISSVVSIATALAPDFTEPQGQQMFQIVQSLRLA